MHCMYVLYRVLKKYFFCYDFYNFLFKKAAYFKVKRRENREKSFCFWYETLETTSINVVSIPLTKISIISRAFIFMLDLFILALKTLMRHPIFAFIKGKNSKFEFQSNKVKSNIHKKSQLTLTTANLLYTLYVSVCVVLR